MSSASLTSTDAVKHSNYHSSYRRGANTKKPKPCGNQNTHSHKKAKTKVNPKHIFKLIHTGRHRKKIYRSKTETIFFSPRQRGGAEVGVSDSCG